MAAPPASLDRLLLPSVAGALLDSAKERHAGLMSPGQPDEFAPLRSPLLVVLREEGDAWLLRPEYGHGALAVRVSHPSGANAQDTTLSLQQALTLVALLQPAQVWRGAITTTLAGAVACDMGELVWGAAPQAEPASHAA